MVLQLVQRRQFVQFVARNTAILIQQIIFGGTEIKNIKEATYEAAGYTGDKVCKSCGVVLEKGKVIPKLEKPTEVPTNKPIDFPTEVKKPDYNKLPVQTEENISI